MGEPKVITASDLQDAAVTLKELASQVREQLPSATSLAAKLDDTSLALSGAAVNMEHKATAAEEGRFPHMAPVDPDAASAEQPETAPAPLRPVEAAVVASTRVGEGPETTSETTPAEVKNEPSQ